MSDNPEELQEEEINVVHNLFEVVRENSSMIGDLQAAGVFVCEIKTDAGDYADADSWDTRIVLNTADNNLKIFSEGSWRTILAY